MLDTKLKQDFIDKLQKLIEDYKDVIEVGDNTDYPSYYYVEIKVWKD